MTTLSKSNIDRLGERLRKSAAPQIADLRLLQDYRAGFRPACDAVALMLKSALGIETSRRIGELRQIEEFPEDRVDEAQVAIFALEMKERLSPQIEVVMIGAPSREALEHTHSQYFFMQKPAGWLAERMPPIQEEQEPTG